MKEKTFHALLLSIVMVAGVVTINDAFAQTNTERLITVTDTTTDTNTMVSNLVGLWSNFDNNFTPILNVIGNLSDELSMVSDKVSMVSDDVMMVDSKIAAFESKFDEFTADDAANAEENQANYDNFAQMLPEIQNTVGMIVDDTDTSFDVISEKLDALQAQVGQFTSSMSTLQDDVAEIQSELGLVQESVQQRIGQPPTDLYDDGTRESVLLSWYTRGLTSIPTGDTTNMGKYNADFVFVCESDVFVKEVSTDLGTQTDVELVFYNNSNYRFTQDIAINPIYDGDADTRDAFTTSLTVGGQNLFNSKFEHGGDTTIVYNINADLNLMELKAGNPLQFKSSVVDTTTRSSTAPADHYLLELIVNAKKNSALAANFTYSADSALAGRANINSNPVPSPTENSHNATKSELASIEAYTVTVNHLSAEMDPKCKIMPSTTADADKSGTTFITIESNKSDNAGTLQKYTRTLDCDLNLATITEVQGEVTGADGLNPFVTVDLMVGDDKKAEFTFEDNLAVIDDESSLPFEFHGQNLIISGDIVKGASILLEVKYDTVKTNGCTIDQ